MGGGAERRKELALFVLRDSRFIFSGLHVKFVCGMRRYSLRRLCLIIGCVDHLGYEASILASRKRKRVHFLIAATRAVDYSAGFSIGCVSGA